MLIKNITKKLSICALLVCAFSVSFAQAFVVKSIRVEGLQKIPVATVLEYIPIKPGQSLAGGADTAHIIQALYQTGFFDSVSLSRQGDTLVVIVQERATIGVIEITGNKQIKKEDLLAALKDAGISEGQAYSESILDGMRQALIHQYNMLGRYNAKVNVTVTSQPRSRVSINIQISEGDVARIKQINIIGNEDFTEKELRKNFKLSKRPWWALFGKKGEYAADKLQEDLEALRNFYLDHGYLKFSIDSSQVSMTPDHKEIYASIRITEGGVYRIAGWKLTGELLGKREVIEKYIRTLKEGDVASRQKIDRVKNSITRYYADMGYAGASVTVEPTFVEGSRVILHFHVDPGDRVYVRNIEYSGNTKTADAVLRRETRQMEGGVYSATEIDQSTRRLNNLGYLENIQVETVPVPGKADQVDLNYSVTEASSTTASAQVGYSDNYGVLYGGNITQKNFKGTGKSVSLGVNNSQFSQVYSFNYLNPYYTPTMSRGFSVFYQKVTPGNANIANYTLDSFGGMINYRAPMSEYTYLTFGYGYEYVRLYTGASPSTQIARFVEQHGNEFNNAKLVFGWSYNDFDRAIFPTRGFNQFLGGEAGVPVLPNSLNYYRFTYDATYYKPLFKGIILALNTELGYGNGYAGFDTLPFFKNFFAGGIGTVRGYEANTLGPRDSRRNALGGNVLTAASAGLIFPNPLGEKVRTGVFFDVGNVFGDTTWDVGGLRYSTGIQVDWFSPIGPLRFSLAKALKINPGDRMQAFQFSVGTSI